MPITGLAGRCAVLPAGIPSPELPATAIKLPVELNVVSEIVTLLIEAFPLTLKLVNVPTEVKILLVTLLDNVFPIKALA